IAFAIHYELGVKATFTWAREALLALEKGSTIFIQVSGTALAASQVIAGYASAEAVLWTFARCLADEGRSLGIRVHCLLPTLTSEPELGGEGIRDTPHYMGIRETAIIEKRGCSYPSFRQP